MAKTRPSTQPVPHREGDRTKSVPTPGRRLVQEAFRDAERIGWSECPVPLARTLEELGATVEVIPSRPGDPPIGLLKAIERAEARRSSLSGRFGRRAFPLHTDGAHLRSPPDAVLLEFRQPTPLAPTLLFPLRPDEVPLSVYHALRQGVFDTGSARAKFLAHAMTDRRLRFDPIAMAPRDRLARLVQQFFDKSINHAIEYHSRGPGITLIIDNRRTLHGRTAVPDDVSREADRAMIKSYPA